MKKSLLTLVMALFTVVTMMAQMTSSSVSGKIVDQNKEEIIGATIQVTHVPTGVTTGTITNANGRYSISGLRAGGPYTVKVSFVGYQTLVFEGLDLPLGENLTQNATLSENAEMLGDVVVVADANSGMRYDRAGAGTSINSKSINAVPTVSRSMNEILKLTPQGGNTGNGFAVGGGNYRSSYVTVDGAAFNNAFGIGSNLPGNGSPISLDALDQMTVSITPFDVRQSGFTGGAINAVTKSGTNDFKGSAYIYNTNVHLRGSHVGDYKLTRNQSDATTYGVTLGGPLVKNKLFFFFSGEWEKNITAGPSATARNSESDEWKVSTGTVHRPLVKDMDDMAAYLGSTYNYNPGRYQGYSLETPAYRIMARMDWNINPNHKLTVRFSTTHSKDSNSPSSSTSPLTHGTIYPGNSALGISKGRDQSGRNANAGMYFESSRYYQERNFTSWAAEYNAKFGNFNNVLRYTYSDQDEPRSYEGGVFPTVDILKDGALYTSFGPDPFTEGNLRAVKTHVITDELTWNTGINNFLFGLQYENNHAKNGYMQGANGYYVFNSWEDFVNGAKPNAYGITYALDKDGKLTSFASEMTYRQFSWYLQDQLNLSENFKLTAGMRFESAIYPKLEDNFNSGFAALKWRDGKQYSTDQVPGTSVTVSPRVGFNWDITGDRKNILRGGIGYFVGRLPFVWLVSAVGNANCGQLQYYYNTPAQATGGEVLFKKDKADQVAQLASQYRTYSTEHTVAPGSPTIIDKDLKMPATWKFSLAYDKKLPGGVDMTLEGILNREINPAVVTNEGYYWDGTKTVEPVPGDKRHSFTQINSGKHNYYITNGGNDAYYYSLTASFRKSFDFGLDLSAAYTYSYAKSYGDGIGDQVSSAYYTNRYSVNGINDQETGYGTYVSPNRLIASVSYNKEYGKHFASHISLMYEGMHMGNAGGYNYTRYSYTWNSNLVGDYGANNLLYIPSSRAELDAWNFVANGKVNDGKGGQIEYTADMQRDDFWNYINQDDYLKDRKGKYTERGGAKMPWRNQFDLKFTQDFFLNVAGKRNTLQVGVDIQNLGNLLNSDWGVYKKVANTNLLNYDKGNVTFAKNGSDRLKETYVNDTSFGSTFRVQFSVKYIFN